MTKRNPEMDERAVNVDNRAGNIAFQVMLWLLLGDMAIRSWWPEVTNWNGFPVDILVVMFAGSGAHMFYSVRARVIGPKRVRAMVLSAVCAAIVSAAALLAVKALL